ncbi:tail fiber assembly protein [Xenorhabdus sp. DI]|uniref:tail fiber assembly protein n=1 Tax=Xenorhabdus doucetiae TaxID=351671 RepID=UPI0019BC86AF|nr:MULTISPECIES: tail fiber assembly protein [unclassified Xenorhabdus]MBD2786383.1 tail fiber assembly protein [Xenorhabdus sp. 3]MBD2790185.1 tail fiber assembly protein [Xenorhabdus sp. DI]
MYRYADNAFHPYVLKQDYINAGSWPDEGIDVDETVFNEFTGQPPEGKQRVTGSDGLPTWEDIPPSPPPTPEQLQEQAEYQKQQWLNAAAEKIDICQDAVDLDIATDAEKSALTEWRRYRVLLNQVDCSTVPDIQWPEQPK